jgi:hypothetical protein
MSTPNPFDPLILVLLGACGAGLGAAIAALVLFWRSGPPAPVPPELSPSAAASQVVEEPPAAVEATPAAPAGDPRPGLGTVLGALFVLALLGAAASSNKDRRDDQ